MRIRKAPPAPLTDRSKAHVQGQLKLITAAAIALQPDYPVIAKSLFAMAKELQGTIDNEK